MTLMTTDRDELLISVSVQDFRDTFFQASPFLPFGPFEKRPTNKFDLQVFAENWSVSSCPRGIDIFHARCFIWLWVIVYFLRGKF